MGRLYQVQSQLDLASVRVPQLFNLGIDAVAEGAEAGTAGYRVQNWLWMSQTMVMQLEDSEVETVLKHPEVDWVYPDRFVDVTLGKEDVGSGPDDWYRDPIQLDERGDHAGLAGNGVRIAVLDTGFDPGVIDVGNRLVEFRDFTSNPRIEPSDPEGHGTAVVNLIASSKNGLAPKAEIVVARVIEEILLDGDPGVRRRQVGAFASRILESMQWIVDQQISDKTRIKVVNGSWGFPTDVDLPPGIFRDALVQMRNMGMLPIFAAGNGPSADPGAVQIPAIYPEVLAVGASTPEGARARFSAIGPVTADPNFVKPEIVAPGVYLPGLPRKARGSDAPSPTRIKGTSYACGIVSGAAALLLEAHPEATIDQIQESLTLSAHDLGPLGPDRETGRGELRVVDALAHLDQASPGSASPVMAGAARLIPRASVLASGWPPVALLTRSPLMGAPTGVSGIR